MLIYLDTNTRQIFGINEMITEQESREYIMDDGSCIWIDTVYKQEVYDVKKYFPQLYLNDDNSIRCELVDLQIAQLTEAQLLAQQIMDIELMLMKNSSKLCSGKATAGQKNLKQRYDSRMIRVDQLQEFVQLGGITEEEYTSIIGESLIKK